MKPRPLALSSSLRRTQFGVLAGVLLVFATAVALVSWHLRAGLRGQILQREGETLAAVATMQLANSEAALAELGLAGDSGELVSAVLQASKLRGVLAIRAFDAEGRLAGALPVTLSEQPPEAETWRRLLEGKAVAQLRDDGDPGTGLPAPTGVAAAGPVPVLDVWVPLRREVGAPLAGVAQFWIDGRGIAGEFATLDRRLAMQALQAWTAGAVLVGAVLLWAFRRLELAGRALEARTEDLHRANRELALAAKTSALGTVTAHLIHGLKSPLAGLEGFLAGATQSGAHEGEGEEWRAANDLTRRLRRMVDDVLAVMKDEETGTSFELTGQELAEAALGKVRALAASHHVELASTVSGEDALPGGRSNLVMLVLQNLLQNAIEATPPGGLVELTVRAGRSHGWEFQVRDTGPGVADAMRSRLFQPCQSTKPGGNGLGLALSQQLAQRVGGRLDYVPGPGAGACFRLFLSAPE